VIYIEDEEYERKIDVIIKAANDIGSAVEIARSERDFRPNQYDRLAAAALELCLSAHRTFAPRTAPNAQGQPAATEPAQQDRRGQLGCADLLGADVQPERNP